MHLISGISSLLAMSLLTPIQSIVALIVLFISTSICLYNQGFVLMGILYIMIYVGAIAVLFLFILSLLNIEYKKAQLVSPLIITLLIISLIPIDLIYEPLYFNTNISDYNLTMELIDIHNELYIIGCLLYADYALLLIITGLILILSVIGAIALTK